MRWRENETEIEESCVAECKLWKAQLEENLPPGASRHQINCNQANHIQRDSFYLSLTTRTAVKVSHVMSNWLVLRVSLIFSPWKACRVPCRPERKLENGWMDEWMNGWIDEWHVLGFCWVFYRHKNCKKKKKNQIKAFKRGSLLYKCSVISWFDHDRTVTNW